ncbi:hypothetical protein [Acetobacter sp. DsW_063]|uniref:hypothetical protein n=1 Tax=Acetobacter sp. DsW_063 TaxID=1514894 RepID=UPI000A3A56D7|nr:hypothetical protein [Acetobacter sp. DsW_063]OUJ16488.1 hypothetical protein HK28_12485 [Acetobacter sp. DsW_063]
MSLTSIEAAIGSVGRLGTSASVVIGSVTLSGAEVPDVIRDGGLQQLVVQRLPGGGRIVDAVGNDPNRIIFSARFLGPNALSRAQLLKKMRVAGKPVAFSAPGFAAQVKIAEYWYEYTRKGAVIPYEIQLEQIPSTTTSSSTASSALSALIGSDASNAITSVTDTISTVSSAISSASSQLGAVVGQITPLASLVGAGSALASVSTDLSAVTSLTGAATNLASAPSSVATMITSMQSAATSLGTTISDAGANLEAITVGDASALTTVAQNASIASTAVDARASVGRAALNTGVASGTTVSVIS